MADINQNTYPKKQSIVRVAFVLLVFASLFFVIKRVYIDRDFILSQEILCDPSVESCFTRLCEEECDAEKEYYKLQSVSARYVSTCDPHIEDCPEINCSEIPTCQTIFCDETTVDDGEWCTNPEIYHPAELEVDIKSLESEEGNAMNE